MYLNNAKGFLHWGFNYYYKALSEGLINPYHHTDANKSFPSGDSFIVYPTLKGCYDSLRLEVFYDGIQDYLALKLLEKYIGREEVVKLLQKEGVSGYTEYPHSASWHISFRNKINSLLDSILIKT